MFSLDGLVDGPAMYMYVFQTNGIEATINNQFNCCFYYIKMLVKTLKKETLKHLCQLKLKFLDVQLHWLLLVCLFSLPLVCEKNRVKLLFETNKYKYLVAFICNKNKFKNSAVFSAFITSCV